MSDFLSILDHAGSVATLLTFPVGAIATLAWAKGWAAKMAPTYKKTILGFLVFVAFVAYGIDVIDRFLIPKKTEDGIIISWGIGATGYTALVNSVDLFEYKDKYKMVLVVRNNYADIDRMTDTRIEKSATYTIVNTPITLAAPNTKKILFIPKAPNVVEFTLIVIPSQFSSEKITTLSDVETLGGKEITRRAATAMAGEVGN